MPVITRKKLPPDHRPSLRRRADNLRAEATSALEKEFSKRDIRFSVSGPAKGSQRLVHYSRKKGLRRSKEQMSNIYSGCSLWSL